MPLATPGANGQPGAGPSSGSLSIDAAWPVSFVGRASPLRRLSRDELVTTFRALTGRAPERSALPEEQRSGHHPLRTSGMAFISSEVGKLLPVIKSFAVELAPELLVQSGCNQTGQAQGHCLAAFGKSLGERALRRPLTLEESNGLSSISSLADGSADADRAAVEGLLTALFFAPSFLYRTEIGTPATDGSGGRVLTQPELSAKLSFFATLGPPDAELAAVAAAGALVDGAERVRQLERLLQTPAGKAAQSVFVLEWLGANESKVAQKSAPYLAGLGADYGAEIRQSADAFVQQVLGSSEPTLTQLLTGQSYLADPAVQRITQASMAGGVPTGDQPAFERLGLLMHPHVVASHTKENGASPFQLGYFLKEVLLCEAVAAPPANAAALAKDEAPTGLSLRESLEFRTSVSAACSGCHAQFAPLGFSFIALDPLGRWVSEDPSGKPWDLSGSVSTASGELSFTDPADMLRQAAARQQVQGCFAQTALEWSLGRGLVEADAPAVIALDTLIRESGGDVPKILRAIVGSPEFVTAVAPK